MSLFDFWGPGFALCGLANLSSSLLNPDQSVAGFASFGALQRFRWSPVRGTGNHQPGGKIQILGETVLLAFSPSRDHIMIFFDIDCKDNLQRFTSLHDIKHIVPGEERPEKR